ncbi:MAG: aldehyde dehydrogenase family protein, partial [Thermoplasmata archaeon]|nr:aldehyde dehydrogenase family protein [Thermoplasmata archaeon]
MTGTTQHGLFIDGKWESPAGSSRFVTRNPATGEELGSFVSGRAEDADRAVEAASRAFPAWRDTPAPKRGEILLRVADVLRHRKEEIGRVVTMEMGKVIA